MAEAPGAVQRQAWVDGVLPPVEQVRPGLWSIPVPIPDNPLRYVLVYAFELPDGVAIVDAGWDTEEAWTALVEGLSKAGCDITDVSAVLITHVHPDHYGLAGRVREHSGAWVGVHPADAAVLPTRYGEVEPLVASMRDLLVDCGVPEVELDELSSASLGIRQFVRQAEPDRFIDDGDRLPLPGWNLRAIWTPGHSPGHLCFAEPDRRLMLTGDCVLPRITPNISVHPQQAANPSPTSSPRWPNCVDINPTRCFPPTNTASTRSQPGWTNFSPITARALVRSNARWPTALGQPAGRSPPAWGGRGPGLRYPTSCAGPPTVKHWPIWRSWRQSTA